MLHAMSINNSLGRPEDIENGNKQKLVVVKNVF